VTAATTSPARTRPSANGSAAGRFTPSAARRSVPLVAVGVLLIAFAALVTGSAFTALDHRTPVVVTARDVGAGHTLTAADLRVARLTLDTGVTTIAGGRLSTLVGQRTRAALPAGSVLAAGQLDTGDGLGADDAVLGLALDAGAAPAGLTAGDLVTIIDTRGDSGSVLVAEAAVRAVDTGDDPRGERLMLSVVVPRERAAAVAAAAAAGHVSVARLPGRR